MLLPTSGGSLFKGWIVAVFSLGFFILFFLLALPTANHYASAASLVCQSSGTTRVGDPSGSIGKCSLNGYKPFPVDVTYSGTVPSDPSSYNICDARRYIGYDANTPQSESCIKIDGTTVKASIRSKIESLIFEPENNRYVLTVGAYINDTNLLATNLTAVVRVWVFRAEGEDLDYCRNNLPIHDPRTEAQNVSINIPDDWRISSGTSTVYIPVSGTGCIGVDTDTWYYTYVNTVGTTKKAYCTGGTGFDGQTNMMYVMGANVCENVGLKGSISGRKYYDETGGGWDGVPGNNHMEKLSDWEITLTGEGKVLKTRTNSDGYYVFDDLLPGNYVISETVKSGWRQTHPTGDFVHNVTLSEGEHKTEQDFYNTLENPRLGPDPTCPSGKEEVFRFGEDTLVRKPPNDVNQYSFENNMGSTAGTVVIYQMEGHPDMGCTPVVDGRAGCDQDQLYETAKGVLNGVEIGRFVDHSPKDDQWFGPFSWDFNNLEFGSNTFVMAHLKESVGERLDSVKYVGVVCANPSLKLGDSVWEDMNYNGIQDEGEPGIDGVSVKLYSNSTCSGTNPLKTQVSQSGGAYTFSKLAPGTYSVSVTTPDGYFPTKANRGGDDGKDSDNPNCQEVSILSSDNLTIDFGYYRPGKVSGYKYEDKSGDGSQGGEGDRAPLQGWEITLTGEDGPSQRKSTDTRGYYEFNLLTPGTYTLSEVLKDGWVQTHPGGNGKHVFTIKSGDVLEQKDFYNFKPNPSYTFEKYVMEQGKGPLEEADTVDDALVVDYGKVLVFKYRIRNNGNVPITVKSLTDDVFGYLEDCSKIGYLIPGVSSSCQYLFNTGDAPPVPEGKVNFGIPTVTYNSPSGTVSLPDQRDPAWYKTNVVSPQCSNVIVTPSNDVGKETQGGKKGYYHLKADVESPVVEVTRAKFVVTTPSGEEEELLCGDGGSSSCTLSGGSGIYSVKYSNYLITKSGEYKFDVFVYDSQSGSWTR